MEAKPFSKKNETPSKPSLLQIACEDYVFIFDLITLENWTSNTITSLYIEINKNNMDINEPSNLEGSVESISKKDLHNQYSIFLSKLLQHPSIIKIGNV